MTEVVWELYPVGKPGQTLIIDGREITVTAEKEDSLAKLADKLLEVNAKLVTGQQIADVESNWAYKVGIEHEGRTKDYRYHVRGQHRPSTIDLVDAIDIAHEYFSEQYPDLNSIGFNVLDASENDGIYEVKCEVKEDHFTSIKSTYIFKIRKDGDILGVKKEGGYSL